MMRSRRPRTFEDMYNKPNRKPQKQASSVFDYEQMDSPRRSDDTEKTESEHLMKREERESPRQSYADTKSSSYIIQKAREIPSAIHGSRKKMQQEPEVKDDKANVTPSGYRSSIIEEIKRERLRKQKRNSAQQETKRSQTKRQSRIHTSPIHLNKIPPQNGVEKADMETQPAKEVAEEIQSPIDIETQNEKKRVGPRFSYPSLHLLGPTQNEKYESEDTKVTEKVIHVFEEIGVPVIKVGYTSNGMFGNYEMRVHGNLRVGQLNQLKTILQPYMKEMHFRITTEKLSSGIINVEVPLIKKNVITYNTLFNASSLRMRRNDFKVVLGKTMDDRAFSFPLTKAGHVLIYGGRNDSVKMIMDNMIISLFMNQTPYDLKLHFIAQKGQYKRYLDIPYNYEAFQDISSDSAFDSILNELIERQNQFRRAQVRNITSFNQRVGPQFRKSIIMVVIDDLHTILKEKNSYGYNALLQLLTKGKSLGIHCIVRQSETSYDLRFELIRLLQTRISFFDPMQRIITGADELSEHRADILVQLPTTSKPTRITLGSMTERVHNDIITHIKTPNLS